MPRPDLLMLTGIWLLLGGCATINPTDVGTREVRQPADLAGCDSSTSDGNSHLDTRVVVGLLDEERYHAALARLDAMPRETAYVQYLRAHVLRQLNRNEQAAALYDDLLTGCMEGYARHGLGLLAATGGDLDGSLEHLARAREQIPLDTRVRNDYGYVLLLAEQPEPAYAEFMTALELNGEARQPRHNMLLTLILLERMNQARDFARRMELSESDIRQAMQEAQRISRDWSQPYQPDQAAMELEDFHTDTDVLLMETGDGDMQGR